MTNAVKPPEAGTIWHSLGNGKAYVVLGVVKNTTNGPADGEVMVHYAQPGGMDEYVREVTQFYERFTKEDAP